MESKTYILLDREYSSESIADAERDVSEAHEYPKDKSYLHLKADKHGFLPGTYRILFVYVEEAKRDE